MKKRQAAISQTLIVFKCYRYFSIVNHLTHNSFRHFIRMYENNVANKLCKWEIDVCVRKIIITACKSIHESIQYVTKWCIRECSDGLWEQNTHTNPTHFGSWWERAVFWNTNKIAQYLSNIMNEFITSLSNVDEEIVVCKMKHTHKDLCVSNA